MRFVDPEVDKCEQEEGFTRYEVMMKDPSTAERLIRIGFAPKGSTNEDIIEEIGKSGLEWLSIIQIDGSRPVL
jgi:hypothetical protein